MPKKKGRSKNKNAGTDGLAAKMASTAVDPPAPPVLGTENGSMPPRSRDYSSQSRMNEKGGKLMTRWR